MCEESHCEKEGRKDRPCTPEADAARGVSLDEFPTFSGEHGLGYILSACSLPRAVTFQCLPRSKSSGKLDCLGDGVACSAYLLDIGYTRVRLSMEFLINFTHFLREDGDNIRKCLRTLRFARFGHNTSPLYLAALARCLCCLRSTLLGSPVDTVHAPVALAVFCSVPVLPEEYTYFYGSTVDTVLTPVCGGFCNFHRFST